MPVLAVTLVATLLVLTGCGGASVGQPGSGSRELASPDPAIAVLEITGEGLGGFSGMHVEDNRLWMLSDRGFVVTAELVFDARGRLVAVTGFQSSRLCGPDGEALGEGIADADAEALLRLPDGSWAVAFERRHRIWRYQAEGLTGCGAADTTHAALPPEVLSLGSNRGIEAMAVLADGRLMILAEDRLDGRHPYWIRRDGIWQSGAYRAEDGFAPTDAVADAEDILVVERFFTPLLGPDARITRYRPGSGDRPVELIRFSEIGLPLDNFEAMALSGRGLFVLSDDNFNAAQRTLLVHFRELPAP